MEQKKIQQIEKSFSDNGAKKNLVFKVLKLVYFKI